jgi:acyl-CoA thioesterase I
MGFHIRIRWFCVACLCCLVACGSGEGADYDASGASETSNPEVASGPRVLFLGDSLAAGLHLPANEAFPAVLAELLEEEGHPIELINAGVSGDTTAGGLARLDWLLKQEPDLLVLELGANDGLRGVALESIEGNLRAIVTRVQAQGTPLLLLGMKLPPNYGQPYASDFEALFADIARDHDLPFVPFFLDGVAGVPRLNLPDGMHPTARGHRLIAELLLPELRELVEGLE